VWQKPPGRRLLLLLLLHTWRRRRTSPRLLVLADSHEAGEEDLRPNYRTTRESERVRESVVFPGNIRTGPCAHRSSVTTQAERTDRPFS
jgi:hypothetical protein